MSTTTDRLQSDTPPYFKMIRFWAYFISVLMGAMTGVLAPIVGVPDWIKLTTGGIATVALAIAGFTYLTTTDPTISKE